MPDSSSGSPGERPSRATWHFNFGDGLVAWAGSKPPDVATLKQARTIGSRHNQSHVPVWAFSTTRNAHLRLESGVEHDLVRELDQRVDVVWLVSQPAKLLYQWLGHRKLQSHVPDLLSLDDKGKVTVWDVRPAGRQDEAFVAAADATREACDVFRWSYEPFDAMGTTRRTNLMWLDGYRQPMPCYAESLRELRANLRTSSTIGDVMALDAGSGHVLAAMWHGIRSGLLTSDLDQRLDPHARIKFAEAAGR